MHIAKDSEVKDHCCKFALSDGTTHYSSSCNHSHTKTCKQCEELETVLNNFLELSENITYENEDQKDDTQYIVSEVTNKQVQYCLMGMGTDTVKPV